MTKTGTRDKLPPVRFTDYHYRIEKENWPEEMFYRDLELENPDLINLPYYSAIRSSARERFDPAERMPRINVASAMSLRGDHELIVRQKVRVHPNHTEVTFMSHYLMTVRATLDRNLLTHPQHPWTPFGDRMAYRWVEKDGKPYAEIFIPGKNTKDADEPAQYFMTAFPAETILRYEPLMVLRFSGPEEPYTIVNKWFNEEYEVETNTDLPVPIMLEPPEHKRTGDNFTQTNMGFVWFPKDSDAAIEVELDKRVIKAYGYLKWLAKSKTITRKDAEKAAIRFSAPHDRLIDYIRMKREERLKAQAAAQQRIDSGKVIPMGASPELVQQQIPVPAPDPEVDIATRMEELKMYGQLVNPVPMIRSRRQKRAEKKATKALDKLNRVNEKAERKLKKKKAKSHKEK